MSRHSVRKAWNTEAVKRHCKRTGNMLFVSHAFDVIKESLAPVDETMQDAIHSMPSRQTGKLDESIEIALGLRVMVVINIATEADIANGTKGIIEDIFLDQWELDVKNGLTADENGIVHLSFPPAAILF
ncbi:hypothetical protein APHAL10511_005405 [Amanita phalloides]|nr:hypothetical protein APHAL10511_005405 [Amanita phalloides]